MQNVATCVVTNLVAGDEDACGDCDAIVANNGTETALAERLSEVVAHVRGKVAA